VLADRGLHHPCRNTVWTCATCFVDPEPVLLRHATGKACAWCGYAVIQALVQEISGQPGCVTVEEKPARRSHASPATTPPDATRARYEALLEVAESIAAHASSRPCCRSQPLLNRLVSFDFISLSLLDARQGVVRLHI